MGRKKKDRETERCVECGKTILHRSMKLTKTVYSVKEKGFVCSDCIRKARLERMMNDNVKEEAVKAPGATPPPETASAPAVSAPMLGDKPTGKERFRRFFREYGYLCFAFIIPVVIMYLIYASMGIHPIGEGSVLVLDLNGQYVSFYEGLRNAIYGDMSMLYSFSRALGGEFLGMYAYYLASPFSYIVALFPQKMILEALLTIFLLKTGLCGLTFGYYLHSHFSKRPTFSRITTVTFSLMYALSAYCIVQQHNSMWIDAVIWLPIVSLGLEGLIEKGHYKLYTAFLALTLVSNFYIGWMVCIYCVAYFLFYYFMRNEKGQNNPYRENTHFAKSFLRFAFFSVLAAAMAAVILMTAYYSLTFGKTTFSNTNWNFKANFDILDMFVKFLPCSYDTVRPEGLPFVYCGMLTVLLIPVFFCNPRYSAREKICSGILVAFFLLSFLIRPADLVWHGFQRPNWLNYRYSFMLCFVLLVMAYKGFLEIRRVHSGVLFFSAGTMLVLLAVAQKTEFSTFILGNSSYHRDHEVGKLLNLECVWLSVLCVGVYLIMLCAMKHTKKPKNVALILAVLISAELFGNGLCNCLDLGADVVYTKYTTYHNTLDPLRDTVTAVTDSDMSFYRLEEASHRKANDNMALNVHGMTSSTSTLNATTIRYLKNMGYFGKSHETRYFPGNLVSDSLLGVKYVLSAQEESNAEARAAKELFADLGYYEEYYSDDNYTVYRNLTALALGYAVSSSVADVDVAEYRNPYERLNAIVTAMLGSDTPVEVFKPLTDYTVSTGGVSKTNGTPTKTSNYKYPYTNYQKVSDNSSAFVRYTVKLPFIDTPDDIRQKIESYLPGEDEDDDYENEHNPYDDVSTQYVFFYLPSEFQREFSFSAPAGSYGKVYGGGSERSLFLGALREGMSSDVTLTLEASNLYVTDGVPLFYYLDRTVFEDAMAKLSKSQLMIDEDYTDDHLTGKITTDGATTVFTSIPYDKGWQVKVDGKRVDIRGIFTDSTLGEKSTDGAVIVFDIADGGEHTVELTYRPKAFTVGLTVSIIGIILFILIIIFEKQLNRFLGKIFMPITVPVTCPEGASESSGDGEDEEKKDSTAPASPPDDKKPPEGEKKRVITVPKGTTVPADRDLDSAEPLPEDSTLKADDLPEAEPAAPAEKIDDTGNGDN